MPTSDKRRDASSGRHGAAPPGSGFVERFDAALRNSAEDHAVRAVRDDSTPEGREVEVHDLQREIHHLKEALRTRPVIDQAKGALMLRYGIDADRAFALLSRWSQDTNIKVRTLAASLTNTIAQPGSQPATGPSSEVLADLGERPGHQGVAAGTLEAWATGLGITESSLMFTLATTPGHDGRYPESYAHLLAEHTEPSNDLAHSASTGPGEQTSSS